QQAFGQITRRRGRSGVAPLQYGRARVEPQAPLLLLGAVARLAALHQDRPDLLLEELERVVSPRRDAKEQEEGQHAHVPKTSSSARRSRAGWASRPVHSLMPMTPWFTSMPRPSSAVHPADSASRTRRVRGGFGMTSQTMRPGRNVL